MVVRITHVVRQYLPSLGGMEEVVRNIVAHQLRIGQRPRIITLDRLFTDPGRTLSAEDVIESVPVLRLPYRGSTRYPFCPSVLGQLAGADVVHVHGIDFFFDYLALTKPLHRKPLVVSTHGGFFHTAYAPRFKKLWFRTITRMSALAYDRVVATSANDGNLFCSTVLPSRLEVIENGVNVEKFAGKASSANISTLIYFGRWSANKGLVETIEFLRCLNTRQPGWQLIIAGREYDVTSGQLQSWVEQNGLGECVHLYPNPSDDELIGLIGQASYFICLSRHEGFGIAPIEAMSAGLIPILSDIPPFRKLVEQSGLGILKLEGDDSAAQDQLIALRRQVAATHAAAMTAARQYAQRYGWEGSASQYTALYEQLGGRRCRAARA